MECLAKFEVTWQLVYQEDSERNVDYFFKSICSNMRWMNHLKYQNVFEISFFKAHSYFYCDTIQHWLCNWEFPPSNLHQWEKKSECKSSLLFIDMHANRSLNCMSLSSYYWFSFTSVYWCSLPNWQKLPAMVLSVLSLLIFELYTQYKKAINSKHSPQKVVHCISWRLVALNYLPIL